MDACCRHRCRNEPSVARAGRRLRVVGTFWRPAQEMIVRHGRLVASWGDIDLRLRDLKSTTKSDGRHLSRIGDRRMLVSVDRSSRHASVEHRRSARLECTDGREKRKKLATRDHYSAAGHAYRRRIRQARRLSGADVRARHDVVLLRLRPQLARGHAHERVRARDLSGLVETERVWPMLGVNADDRRVAFDDEPACVLRRALTASSTVSLLRE